MGKITAPVALSTVHTFSDFQCGDANLTEWIKTEGLKSQSIGSSRTFVVCREHSSPVIGFYSLTTAKIVHAIASDSLEINIPVIILARLAVDMNYHGRGLGGDLLHDAILRIYRVADSIGVRAVMAPALSETARNFYLHNGFIPSKAQLNMFFLPCRNVV